jgi:hypothetical protein
VKKFSVHPGIALILGFLVTSPFFLLEWFTSPGFPQGFPLNLFIFMWLSSSASVFLLRSVYKDFREKRKTNFLILIMKIALLISLVWGYAELVIDQWPCFMGIPNCD